MLHDLLFFCANELRPSSSLLVIQHLLCPEFLFVAQVESCFLNMQKFASICLLPFFFFSFFFLVTDEKRSFPVTRGPTGWFSWPPSGRPHTKKWHADYQGFSVYFGSVSLYVLYIVIQPPSPMIRVWHSLWMILNGLDHVGESLEPWRETHMKERDPAHPTSKSQMPFVFSSKLAGVVPGIRYKNCKMTPSAKPLPDPLERTQLERRV